MESVTNPIRRISSLYALTDGIIRSRFKEGLSNLRASSPALVGAAATTSKETIEYGQDTLLQMSGPLADQLAFVYAALTEVPLGVQTAELTVHRPNIDPRTINDYIQRALPLIFQTLSSIYIGLVQLLLGFKVIWDLPIFFASVHAPYVSSLGQSVRDALIGVCSLLFHYVSACGYTLWNLPIVLGEALISSSAKLGGVLQKLPAALTTLTAPLVPYLEFLGPALQSLPVRVTALACISAPYLIILGEFLWDLPVNLAHVPIFLVGTVGPPILLGLVLFNVFLSVAVFKGAFPGEPLDHVGFAVDFALSPVLFVVRAITYAVRYLWLLAVRAAPSVPLLLLALGERVARLGERALRCGRWCAWVGSALFTVTLLNTVDGSCCLAYWPCAVLCLVVRLVLVSVRQILVLFGRLVANVWLLAQTVFDQFVVFLARHESHRQGYNRTNSSWLARQGGTWMARLGWLVVFYVVASTLSWILYELH